MSEKYLKFGTGGLRGIMGPATNQMNMNTIRRATKGLATYIVSLGRQADGVVIGHDTRMNSREFALEAAGVLLAEGIKVYLFDRCTPTPEISFAIRQKKAVAGIVITASHNAKEYNGYKVYWEDGGQITPPHDKNIMAEVEKVEHVENVQVIDIPACAQIVACGKASEEMNHRMSLFHELGEDIEENYISTIKQTVESLIDTSKGDKDLKIAYTPLHGTGLYPVTKALKNSGFSNVYLEPAQSVQDGTFPTVGYPNPESEKAWELGLAFAKEVDADVVFATDPDADRVGMYVKDAASGEYIWFTGNMAGVLVGEYILREGKFVQKFQVDSADEKTVADKKNTIVRTIVTSKMLDVIAKRYNVEVLETLTGFKYIGEQIRWFEEKLDRNYVYGFEESCGCLLGDYVRDKDGVAAVLMLCEMAQNLKREGITLWDRMQEIYAEYGYYLEKQKTIAFEGEDGAEKMSQIMDKIRINTPKEIGDFKVIAFRDYKKGTRMLSDTGVEEMLTLPKSNVMYFELRKPEKESSGEPDAWLNDEAWCCIRPSGTEPKLKMYFGVVGTSQDDAENLAKLMEESFINLFWA